MQARNAVRIACYCLLALLMVTVACSTAAAQGKGGPPFPPPGGPPFPPPSGPPFPPPPGGGNPAANPEIDLGFMGSALVVLTLGLLILTDRARRNRQVALER